jgi:D-amino peptidase
MKVFISIDLEGISGISSEPQTEPGTAEYRRDTELMRGDLDAALDGCWAAGAGEVVVCDAHDLGGNLTFRELPPAASLVSGSPSPLSMMQGIDETFDVAMFVGYHAMAGTTGAVIDHTYTGSVFKVRIDDALEVGEVGINAGVAGAFGVPVVFVSGDDKLAAEAVELIPGIETAVVKEGQSRTCARLLSPETAHQRIREGVERALRKDPRPKPLDFSGSPLRLTFQATRYCDQAVLCPGVRRVDARAVEITGKTYVDVFRTFLACLDLASPAHAG